MRVVLFSSMRHFPDGDRYEFHGHAFGDRGVRIMVTLHGTRGAELYERFLGYEVDAPSGGAKTVAEDRVELEIEDAAVSFP